MPIEGRSQSIGLGFESPYFTEILDGLNSIPVKFTENALGELTIEVNGKAIYTMKRDELICKDLLRAFAHSIKEEIQ